MTDDTPDRPETAKEPPPGEMVEAQKTQQQFVHSEEAAKAEAVNITDITKRTTEESKANGDSEKAAAVEDPGKMAAAVVVAPPDGGWGWVVVAASFVCNFFVDGAIFSFGPFLTEIQVSLEVSYTQVALVGSLLSGCYLLAGPFVSALTNKYGFRLVTIVGSILASAGFFGASFAASVYEMFFFYGLIGGVGFGLIYSPSVLIVGYYFERWRALATGIAVCGSGVGILVFGPLNMALIDSFGWRMAVRIQSAMILICVICGILFRPLPPLKIELEPEEENFPSKFKVKKGAGGYPTAAEILQISKSTQSLTPSVILTRVAALSGQTNTQSVPMIPMIKKRDRTASENSSIGNQDHSRRGTVTDYVARSRRGTLTKLEDLAAVNRPLYRDDIFFSGSLHRLPDYKSSQRDFMGYTLSVTRLPTKKDLEEEEECTCFPEAVKRALGTLFDTSLLTSPSFVLLCISGFLSLMGIFTPFMYMADRAEQGGWNRTDAAFLLSAVGMTNTVGRVICGILSSCPCMDALLINNIALTLGGVATMISGLSLSPVAQYSFSAAFGFTLACFASLRSILAVDLLGIEKLTNAFGLLCLFQGLAAVLGAPIAGYIREATGSFTWSFILAGGFILLSGIMCYPLKVISRWEKRKRKEENPDETFI